MSKVIGKLGVLCDTSFLIRLPADQCLNTHAFSNLVAQNSSPSSLRGAGLGCVKVLIENPPTMVKGTQEVIDEFGKDLDEG